MDTNRSQDSIDGPAVINKHEKISVGRKWHPIDCIEDDTIFAEWPDGSPVIFDRCQLSRCKCGILILGEGPCIDCDDRGSDQR